MPCAPGTVFSPFACFNNTWVCGTAEGIAQKEAEAVSGVTGSDGLVFDDSADCEDGWVASVGVCYQMLDSPLTFADCLSACQALSADVMEPKTDAARTVGQALFTFPIDSMNQRVAWVNANMTAALDGWQWRSDNAAVADELFSKTPEKLLRLLNWLNYDGALRWFHGCLELGYDDGLLSVRNCRKKSKCVCTKEPDI